MTEVLDTSALILARRDPAVAEWLRAAIVADRVAICDQVAIEYLRGARSAAEFDEYDDVLSAFPRLRIEPVDWDRIRVVYRSLSAITGGYQQSVPIADALIAAVAERHGLTVVHYDQDFDRIAAITGQDVRWVAPRGSVA